MQPLSFRTWVRSFLTLAGVLATSQDIPAQAQAAPNLAAQTLALNRAGEALDHVVTSAKKINARLKYGFFEQGCVFGVMLRPGASASETFGLLAGQSYMFIGGADKSARNVDVVITDSAGRVVKEDTEQDASPFVIFKPQKSGRYKMALRLTAAKSGTAFCAVTVLRKGGYDIPIERISEAVAKAAVASGLIFREVKGGRFNQDRDTWALYGAVLKPKQTISSDPKIYSTANRGFVGVGDNRIKDLDLFLLNSKGQRVASDTKNGEAAGVGYRTTHGTYSVALANNSSNGPALVMTILIELPAGVHAGFDNNDEPTRLGKNVTPPTAGRPSPFSGKWSGDWTDGGNTQEGEFKMTVAADGKLTGSVTNKTVNVTSPMQGVMRPDGVFAFAYSYQGQNYVAQGKMSFADGDTTSVDGQVAFTHNGQAFGKADFGMDKDN